MPDLNKALAWLERGTYNPGDLELTMWDYYDRAVMLAATLQHQFFMVPFGQGGKGYSDTNFPLAGQMPNNEKMSVMYLGFTLVPTSTWTQAILDNWNDVKRNSYINFVINNKSSQLQIPLHAAFGDSQPLMVTGGAAGDQLTTRDMSQHAYPLDIDIRLAAKTSFRIDWIFDAAGNAALDDCELYIHMIGPRWAM